jgi:hypothetical protein
MTTDTPRVLHIAFRDNGGLATVPMFVQPGMGEEWVRREEPEQTFYIDCEFDGHGGPLLSIAMVREDGWSIHVSTGVVAEDPWVIANVLPWMNCHEAQNDRRVRPRQVGAILRDFIGDCQRPTIIADSPVDIGRFCEAISTGDDGGWASTGYVGMTFIVRNVDCYPTTLKGAVQHNAWWDAMALRAALTEGDTP